MIWVIKHRFYILTAHTLCSILYSLILVEFVLSNYEFVFKLAMAVWHWSFEASLQFPWTTESELALVWNIHVIDDVQQQLLFCLNESLFAVWSYDSSTLPHLHSDRWLAACVWAPQHNLTPLKMHKFVGCSLSCCVVAVGLLSLRLIICIMGSSRKRGCSGLWDHFHLMQSLTIQ